ncbi:MAG: outer membrane lipoprotein carrier protein LolA [Spirochaetaceae bacterium]|nr:outer membrane lipoprotein carrier protein LolA [Spirochaetaceae bacterium]
MGLGSLRTKIIVLFLLSTGLPHLTTQEIITAERYLQTVAERYGVIRDYEAKIQIRAGGTDMYGTVSHLSPSFLRIDFTRPAEQVILFNGDVLTIYLPQYNAVLNQAISGNARTSGASVATAQGLTLLRRNFIPVFVTGPDPQPLEKGSDELVVLLRLSRRSVSEGFREILLSVNPQTKLIRRIVGTSVADGQVRFDFSDMKVNQGIPEQRFIYDSPASANMFNNFLFQDTD